jgi:hypothetical protein
MNAEKQKRARMLRPQTRPVQISATVFQQLADYCYEHELNMARIIEEVVLERALEVGAASRTSTQNMNSVRRDISSRARSQSKFVLAEIDCEMSKKGLRLEDLDEERKAVFEEAIFSVLRDFAANCYEIESPKEVQGGQQ